MSYYGIAPFLASSNGLFTFSQTTQGCKPDEFIISPEKPNIYISFDRIEKDANDNKQNNNDQIYLHLYNNTRWGISIVTESGSDTFFNKEWEKDREKMSIRSGNILGIKDGHEIDVTYIIESRTGEKIHTDACGENLLRGYQWLPSGRSLTFKVAKDLLLDNPSCYLT